MGKQLIIKIKPNGVIESKTVNIHGQACEKYIGIVEKMAEAKVVDSEYTDDFRKTDNLIETETELKQEVGK